MGMLQIPLLPNPYPEDDDMEIEVDIKTEERLLNRPTDYIAASYIYNRPDIRNWILYKLPNLIIEGQNNYFRFRDYCIKGDYRMAAQVYDEYPTINIHEHNELIFNECCAEGHISVVFWLLKIRPNINTSANNNKAFKNALSNSHKQYMIVNKSLQTIDNHLKIAQGLYGINPNIIDNIDVNEILTFIASSKYDDIDTFEWFYSIIVKHNRVDEIDWHYVFHNACLNHVFCEHICERKILTSILKKDYSITYIFNEIKNMFSYSRKCLEQWMMSKEIKNIVNKARRCKYKYLCGYQ